MEFILPWQQERTGCGLRAQIQDYIQHSTQSLVLVLRAESCEGGDVWRLGGSAAILRLSWQTCERCFTKFDMKTLVHGRVWFVKCASVSG